MPDPSLPSTSSTSSAIGRASAPRVVRVCSDQLIDAVELVSLDGRPAGAAGAANLIQYCRENRIRLDLCFALKQKDRFLHTFIAVANPGRTALIFVSPPESRPLLATSGRSLLTELICSAHRSLEAADMVLAQVLLTPEERRLRPHFEEAGYRRLAELSYLEARIRRSAAESDGRSDPAWQGIRWPDGARVHAWRESLADGFKAALQASYRNSRDCPGLEQFRDIDDILVGHRGQGDFNPDLWTLVTINEDPAAVLLLNAFPDGTTVELTYIGVSDRFRRLGLARSLMHLARRQVARLGRPRLTLAVDEANLPAIRLYEAFGLRRTSRRTALIRPVGPKDWGDNGPAPGTSRFAEPGTESV